MLKELCFSSTDLLFILLTHQVQSYFGAGVLAVSMPWMFHPRILYVQLFYIQFSAYYLLQIISF